MPQRVKVSISIVSHGQAALVEDVLHDLRAHCITPLEVILTLNIPEPVPFDIKQFGFVVKLIKNENAKGFAANHNAAFSVAQADHFCVLNPDVRFERDPFPVLLEQISDPKIGVAAPLIMNSAGGIEDSARRFPTPLSILHKIVFGQATLDYKIKNERVSPDWVAGMFMVFKAELYRMIRGFDESYFLYYEDVDLCWRLRRSGFEVVLDPRARVVHEARRTSHRDLQYFRWHLASMLRFFVRRTLGH